MQRVPGEIQPVKDRLTRLFVTVGIAGLSLRLCLEIFCHAIEIARVSSYQGENELSKKYDSGLMLGGMSFKLTLPVS